MTKIEKTRAAGAFQDAAAGQSARFIGQVIDYVEAHSIRPAQDRARFAAKLRAATAGAADVEATFPALREALSGLGDNRHSRLLTGDDDTLAGEGLRGDMREGIATATVPAYAGDGGLSMRYVAEGQAVIAALDAQKPAGWVVDLRDNDGGNVFAMLGALGPLLETGDGGDGHLGFFQTRQGHEPFGCKDGAAWADSMDGRDIFARLPRKTAPVHLLRPPAAIAVLVGPRTASAAEMTAIALRGLGSHVRLFGAPTRGQATLNRYIPDLPTDAAQVAIACATLADRTGKKYDYTLTPDFFTEGNDAIPEGARRWLKNPGVSRQDCGPAPTVPA